MDPKLSNLVKSIKINQNLCTTIVCYIFLLMVVSACNAGNHISNNYATFEIIDQQTANGAASETILTALSTQKFNSYNPILGFQTESANALSLGANDSLDVSVNGAASASLTLLALGFYNYTNPTTINYENLMNLNKYSFVLMYDGSSTTTSMNVFPRIYTPLSGTCKTVANGTTGVNDTNCTISTTNTVIPYNLGTITYKLTGTLTNSCLGTITSSSINYDVVSFQNCQILNNTAQIQLQIASNATIASTSDSSFNVRGQYYFLSPLTVVTKE